LESLIMKNVIASLAIVASATAGAAGLTVQPYNPGTKAIFPVTSTLVYGDHEALLVDAQFEGRYARELVTRIRATGRELKYVFISHSDPDYYFGLDVIKAAFPKAKVLSTAQTAYLISASEEEKLAVWKDKLGDGAPAQLSVPQAMDGSGLVIDGEQVQVRQDPADSAHSYLWIPSTRTVLGGIPVSNGGHLWMADTRGVAEIDAWIKRIDDMKSLQPLAVVPGHAGALSTDPAQLDVVRDYLVDYRAAVGGHATAAAIVAAMKAKYPDLPGTQSLEMGAKVFTGEMPWKVWSPYSPIGRTLSVDFGTSQFELTFKDNSHMSFVGTAGRFKGMADAVTYEAVEVAPKVFMVYWHEPASGSDVVHIQDYNSGAVYTNISGKDHSFKHLRGTMAVH
jgi:glyoxylase-like metal-dependent hydrolase (beta-lactamase superfamily II)